MNDVISTIEALHQINATMQNEDFVFILPCLSPYIL